MSERDYSFQIRDNYDPVQLVWEDVIVDGTICGNMPMIRKNYKEEEIDYAVWLSQMDQINVIERTMKWENIFTNT